MKKNIILSVSKVIMQIVRVIISLSAAIHVLIVIGSLIKDIPSQEIVNQIEILIFNEGGLKIHELTNSNQWLSDLLILQNLVTLVLLFNILGYGIEIIRNIQRNKTFTTVNIKSFDKISQISVTFFYKVYKVKSYQNRNWL